MGRRADQIIGISDHKISKYIDYPNMKDLFLSLQARNGVGFDSPALRAPPQEGDAYRTQLLRRFARPPFKGARGIRTILIFSGNL